MKRYSFIVLLSVFCLTASAMKPEPGKKGFVVIELFTSEGCSSCPPADELVAKVQKEYQDQPVYILAYHVDYWNRLGWKDVFSDARYSKRQQDYAQTLHLQSVYTPQIVVNGTREFVGSEEGNLRSAIAGGLGKTSSAQIVITNVKSAGSKLDINYKVDGGANHSELIFALVQKSAQTNVKAGENSGRKLSHVQIVRQLQSVSVGANANGSSVLTLPQGFNSQNFEVIALLQDSSSGEIIGAAKQAVPTKA